VFLFSRQLLSETFLILRRTEQDMIKMYIGLHVKYPYSCPILMKLEFSQQIVRKYSNMKFIENQSIGSWVVPCGQTYRQTDMKKLIVNFTILLMCLTI